MANKNNIALALDNISKINALKELITATKDSVGVYKIGFEQFIRFGPAILDPVKELGAKIFLDMKLHDIPNTVAKAVTSASEHEVDYLTLHAIGGIPMLSAAAEAAARAAKAPKLIGVTVLTSVDQTCMNNDMKIEGTVEEQVKHLASVANQSGIDGIVCSAADLSVVKPTLPSSFEIITPGIRPAGVDAGDQKRVATPKSAIDAGATLLVIGRAITSAEDPAQAAAEILTSITC